MARADEVASVLADCLGGYDWAVLWAYGLPWGDRSLEAVPPPDWRRYAEWRRRHDEHRTLYDAPGHEFESANREQLASAIQSAIYMGWDARAFGYPLRCIIDPSHDDTITLRSQHNLSEVTGRLVGLGLRQVSITGS